MRNRLVAASALATAALAATGAGPAATPGVTIDAQPRVARWTGGPVTLSGAIATAKENELVTIQLKECGPHAPFFRNVGAVRTNERGGWSMPWFFRVSAVARATWRDAVSTQVAVQARAGVQLNHLSGNRYEVSAGGILSFYRKRVLIQRLKRTLGTWETMKTVVLTESGGGGSSFSWSSAKFRSVVPQGTLVRAVFPRSQARPCYLAGYSNLVRR